MQYPSWQSGTPKLDKVLGSEKLPNFDDRWENSDGCCMEGSQIATSQVAATDSWRALSFFTRQFAILVSGFHWKLEDCYILIPGHITPHLLQVELGCLLLRLVGSRGGSQIRSDGVRNQQRDAHPSHGAQLLPLLHRCCTGWLRFEPQLGRRRRLWWIQPPHW